MTIIVEELGLTGGRMYYSIKNYFSDSSYDHIVLDNYDLKELRLTLERMAKGG